MQITQAHWHLLLNHFPIILSIIGTGFLVFALILKKQFLKLSGFILLVLAASFAIPAFETGESAEDSVEKLAGISHQQIHTHEDAASVGYKIILTTGILALISISFGERKNKFATLFLILTFIAGIVSSGYLSYIGKTGGEIRHPEINQSINLNNKSNNIEHE